MVELDEESDMVDRTCTVAGCEKPPRRAGSDWCGMHYHRWYRHGSVDAVASRTTDPEATGRYRIVEKPSHPTAAKCGKAYEHRVVLFDSIGSGWHDCHWCGKRVTWDLPSTNPDGLQVDHLNDRRDDNRLENLVVACPDCNGTRAAQQRSDRLRAAGLWSGNDTVARLGTRKPRVGSAA